MSSNYADYSQYSTQNYQQNEWISPPVSTDAQNYQYQSSEVNSTASNSQAEEYHYNYSEADGSYQQVGNYKSNAGSGYQHQPASTDSYPASGTYNQQNYGGYTAGSYGDYATQATVYNNNESYNYSNSYDNYVQSNNYDGSNVTSSNSYDYDAYYSSYNNGGESGYTNYDTNYSVDNSQNSYCTGSNTNDSQSSGYMQSGENKREDKLSRMGSTQSWRGSGRGHKGDGNHRGSRGRGYGGSNRTDNGESNFQKENNFNRSRGGYTAGGFMDNKFSQRDNGYGRGSRGNNQFSRGGRGEGGFQRRGRGVNQGGDGFSRGRGNSSFNRGRGFDGDGGQWGGYRGKRQEDFRGQRNNRGRGGFRGRGAQRTENIRDNQMQHKQDLKRRNISQDGSPPDKITKVEIETNAESKDVQAVVQAVAKRKVAGTGQLIKSQILTEESMKKDTDQDENKTEISDTSETQSKSNASQEQSLDSKSESKKDSENKQNDSELDAEVEAKLSQLVEPLHCILCGLTMNNMLQSEQHYNGKNHAKKVRLYRQSVALANTLKRLENEGSIVSGETVTLAELPDEEEATKKVEKEKTKNTDSENLVGTSPEIYCKVCDVAFNSPKQATQHYEGKNHLKKVRLTSQSSENIDSVNKEHVTIDGNIFECKMCSVHVTCEDQLNAHLQGAKHKNKLKMQQRNDEGWNNSKGSYRGRGDWRGRGTSSRGRGSAQSRGRGDDFGFRGRGMMRRGRGFRR